jgi:hypothetical protein
MKPFYSYRTTEVEVTNHYPVGVNRYRPYNIYNQALTSVTHNLARKSKNIFRIFIHRTTHIFHRVRDVMLYFFIIN